MIVNADDELLLAGAELEELELLLVPVDQEVAFIEAEIARSHCAGWDFSVEAREFRAPFFERLTVLSEEYGKLRIRRAAQRRLVKLLRKEAAA